MCDWKFVGSIIASVLIGAAVSQLVTKSKQKDKKQGEDQKPNEEKEQRVEMTKRPYPGPWVNTALFFPDYDNSSSTTKKLMDYFGQAKFRIQLCLFRFSFRPLGNIIMTKLKEGLLIQIILDYDVYKDWGSGNGLVKRLSEAGAHVKLRRSSMHMHHKFGICDENLVLTGSLNWTEQGITQNDEDVLISVEQGHVRQYMARYDDLWKGSVGVQSD